MPSAWHCLVCGHEYHTRHEASGCAYSHLKDLKLENQKLRVIIESAKEVLRKFRQSNKDDLDRLCLTKHGRMRNLDTSKLEDLKVLAIDHHIHQLETIVKILEGPKSEAQE